MRKRNNKGAQTPCVNGICLLSNYIKKIIEERRRKAMFKRIWKRIEEQL